MGGRGVDGPRQPGTGRVLRSTPETLRLALDEMGAESTLLQTLLDLPVQLLDEVEYRWAGRAGGVQIFPACRVIPADRWTGGTLSVLVHSKNTWTSTAALRVILQCTAPTGDDPSKQFPGANVATVTIYNGTSSPCVQVAEVDEAPLGGALRLILRWDQGATAPAASVTQDIELSVQLAGRPRLALPDWTGDP